MVNKNALSGEYFLQLDAVEFIDWVIDSGKKQ